MRMVFPYELSNGIGLIVILLDWLGKITIYAEKVVPLTEQELNIRFKKRLYNELLYRVKDSIFEEYINIDDIINDIEVYLPEDVKYDILDVFVDDNSIQRVYNVNDKVYYLVTTAIGYIDEFDNYKDDVVVNMFYNYYAGVDISPDDIIRLQEVDVESWIYEYILKHT